MNSFQKQNNSKEYRLTRKKAAMFEKVEDYLLARKGHTVMPSEIYSELGESRTILWRIFPEVGRYIGERVRSHNHRSKT